jgi:hypothetical protein
MTTPDHEPLLETLRDDPALSRVLRTSLLALREQSSSDEFRRMVDDVLTGRRHLRDVFSSPAFAGELDPLVQRFGEQYEALPDDERQRLAEQVSASWPRRTNGSSGNVPNRSATAGNPRRDVLFSGQLVRSTVVEVLARWGLHAWATMGPHMSDRCPAARYPPMRAKQCLLRQ